RCDRFVATGDRAVLAVVFLRLLTVDAAEYVVVLLLQTTGALEIGVGATDHAAADVATGQLALVLADGRHAGAPQGNHGVGEVRIDLAGDVDERILLRGERIEQ